MLSVVPLQIMEIYWLEVINAEIELEDAYDFVQAELVSCWYCCTINKMFQKSRILV